MNGKIASTSSCEKQLKKNTKKKQANPCKEFPFLHPPLYLGRPLNRKIKDISSWAMICSDIRSNRS
jgi:hypothetical protein